MKKTILLVLVLALGLAAGVANADFVCGTAVNLGSNVNSSSNDAGPSISADGLTLYFSSNRSGGEGGYDLWCTTRATINDDWGPAANLGQPPNSQYSYWEPSISSDGLTLYFSDGHSPEFGNRLPGGLGGQGDIWMVTRPSINDAWGEPINLGPAVNSQHAIHPSISSDSLSLYFQSHRPGALGHCDIMVATRGTTSELFGAPAFLTNVSTGAGEWTPDIFADGMTLFFSRQSAPPYLEIWLATREAADDPFGTPIKLPPHVNVSSCYNFGPNLSVDGSTLYFTSSRPGGFGAWDLWQVPITPIVDFNGDGIVDFRDLSKLVQYWLQNEPAVDIGPTPLGDGIVDLKDLAVFAEYWVEEILYIKWFAHASVKVWTEDAVVYVDPRNLSESPHDATLVLVTHTHGDHYQPADIAKVSNAQTQFIAPPDVVQQYGQGQPIAPGQRIVSSGVPVTAVPAYNINKTNHPKSNNWVGYIIELGGKRVYVAGDTDLIPEMQTLGKIDVAILPAGGTYTMNATEAAEAATIINPRLAIPYHWGTSVGTLADAQTFAQLARCAVKIMAAGETIGSDNWPEYSPLRARWKLDETEGNVAEDSGGDNDGTLHGNPAWQPTGGKIDGALQFDGVGDYVSTPSVFDPADGAFSVFAWVKGGAAGQVIISQTDGTGTGATWLGAEQSQGKLMTGLVPPRAGRFVTPPLVSEFIIIDGQWYHIGFVWDGSLRHLYVDGAEVARDAAALAPLISSDGDLYFGADKDRDAAGFFSGLIDDVRIYDQALSAEQIEELTR